MFEIGEKVKILSKSMGDCDLISRYPNRVGWIRTLRGNGEITVWIDEQQSDYFSFLERDLQKLTNKTIMRTLNNMMKKLLDADTQLLVKMEYINGDLELTAKGKVALESLNFIDRKAELVALAQEELTEAEKVKA